MGQGSTIKKTIDPELIAVKFAEQVVLGKKKRGDTFYKYNMLIFLLRILTPLRNTKISRKKWLPIDTCLLKAKVRT